MEDLRGRGRVEAMWWRKKNRREGREWRRHGDGERGECDRVNMYCKHWQS